MTYLKYRGLPKLPVVLFVTIICSIASAQDKNVNEIIAEGSSKIKIKPDLSIIILTVEKTDSVERKVIERLNMEVNNLINALYTIGFTNTTIRIADYDVSSTQDDDGKKKYTASNALKLEFGLDTKLINEVYKVLQERKLSDVDISFDTQLSDSLEKRTRSILVQQAIADAKNNAENIAQALNIKISGVKQVLKYVPTFLGNDKVEIVQFTPPTVVKDTKFEYNTSFSKFQVEEMELEEKITIIYEISR